MRRLLAVAVAVIMASAMTIAFAEEKALVGEQETALMRIEYQWAHAYLTKDFRVINKILADDYVALGSDGVFQTKAELMDELRYGFVKYEALNVNPMTVRVFGNTAIVVGSNDEISTRMEMDTSGHYVWTDVFVLRDGNWQAVASQGALVPDMSNFYVPTED